MFYFWLFGESLYLNNCPFWYEAIEFIHLYLISLQILKAVAQSCSVKKIFFEISQNSQEMTCAKVSFLIKFYFIKKESLAQVFSYELYEISKNTFLYRTSPVAASEILVLSYMFFF